MSAPVPQKSKTAATHSANAKSAGVRTWANRSRANMTAKTSQTTRMEAKTGLRAEGMLTRSSPGVSSIVARAGGGVVTRQFYLAQGGDGTGYTPEAKR